MTVGDLHAVRNLQYAGSKWYMRLEPSGFYVCHYGTQNRWCGTWKLGKDGVVTIAEACVTVDDEGVARATPTFEVTLHLRWDDRRQLVGTSEGGSWGGSLMLERQVD